MPVEPRDFDGMMIVGRKPTVVSEPEEDEEKANANRDVQGVKAGHGPIQEPEDLGLSGEFFGEVGSGPKVFVEIGFIFEGFDCKKTEAEKSREQEMADEPFAVVELGGTDGESHGQTAGEEHGGIDCAEE